MGEYRELLMGAGSSRVKRLIYSGHKDAEFTNPTTLDNNSDHKPDVLWDLTVHPLPFDDDTFDEIHAYDVLEHLAAQGDYLFFFAEFSEYWRILKPGGIFIASVPHYQSVWAWGDPSHRRVIQEETLIFLDQREYAQVGHTKMSDLRNIYKADFRKRYAQTTKGDFAFALEAVKHKGGNHGDTL